jgi:hypothetical protein
MYLYQRSLLLVFLSSFVASCGAEATAQQQSAITDDQLCQFRYGATTAADVTSALGLPSTSGTSLDVSFVIYQRQLSADVSDTVMFAFQGGRLVEITRTAVGAAAAPLPSCLQPSTTDAGVMP